MEAALRVLADRPAVVVANAGIVNSTDLDDLRALAKLKEEYPFWLHVDAAFGGFAAVVPELAGSITIDAHKWLNVAGDLCHRHQVLHPSMRISG